MAPKCFQSLTVRSLRALDGKVVVNDEDIVDVRLGRAVRRHKVRLANDEPLGLPVVLPLGGHEAGLVVLARNVDRGDLDETGLALESSARSESNGEGRQLKEDTEPVRFRTEHNRTDEVDEVLLQQITRARLGVGVASGALALAGAVDFGLGLVVQVRRVASPVREHLLGELGHLDTARRAQTADTGTNVGGLVVGVQRDKVTQLAVDDPLDNALAVLALNLEPLAAAAFLLFVGQWSIGTGDLQLLVLALVADTHAVADAEAEITQQNRHCTVSILVAVDPGLHDHNGKRVREKLIGDIRGAHLSLLRSLLALLPSEPQCVAHLTSTRASSRRTELVAARVLDPGTGCVRHGPSARRQGRDG